MIQSADGTETAQLERIELSTGQETLGIKLALDGNMKSQKAYLQQHSREFAAHLLKGGKLSKNAAWRAMKTTIMSCLKYPLAPQT